MNILLKNTPRGVFNLGMNKPFRRVDEPTVHLKMFSIDTGGSPVNRFVVLKEVKIKNFEFGTILELCAAKKFGKVLPFAPLTMQGQ